MRRYLVAAALVFAGRFVAPAAVSPFDGPLTEVDRDRVESELQASRTLFLDAIAGLSPAQWTFKPGPTRWSIAEVAEHVVKAEGFIGAVVRESVATTPADTTTAAQRQPENPKLDDEALAAIRDRSKKAEAPAPIVPTGIYQTPQQAAEAFEIASASTIEYVRTTHADLRAHFSSQITGSPLDGVQLLLTLSGHTERHVAQIEEVKRSPGYPSV